LATRRSDTPAVAVAGGVTVWGVPGGEPGTTYTAVAVLVVPLCMFGVEQ
jgi:hypothetical protein